MSAIREHNDFTLSLYRENVLEWGGAAPLKPAEDKHRPPITKVFSILTNNFCLEKSMDAIIHLSLQLKSANLPPSPNDAAKEHLVWTDDGYMIGKPLFDEDQNFLCFIVDNIGNGYPLHAHEFISWASLPTIQR